jgi:hypothetical protein
MPQRFTLVEAESLLPVVEKLLREAVALKTRYEELQGALSAFNQRVMMTGGMVVDRETVIKNRQRRDECGQKLKSVIEEIQASGCLIKDLDIGLVDFPTMFHGREVYLCWKLGEKGINFWHGTDEGFAGRKPVDQDFLENHRGDTPN